MNIILGKLLPSNASSRKPIKDAPDLVDTNAGAR